MEAGHVKFNVEADKVNHRNMQQSVLEIISDLRKLANNAQPTNSNDTKENVPESTLGTSRSQSSQTPDNSQSQSSQVSHNSQQPTAVNSDDYETQGNNSYI